MVARNRTPAAACNCGGIGRAHLGLLSRHLLFRVAGDGFFILKSSIHNVFVLSPVAAAVPVRCDIWVELV